VKGDGNPPLLPEPRCADLSGFAQHNRSFGDQYMLVVMRVDGGSNHHLHWPNRIAVQAVHQDGFKNRSLIDDIGLADCRVDVDFCSALSPGVCAS